jgi:hypothetical protein
LAGMMGEHLERKSGRRAPPTYLLTWVMKTVYTKDWRRSRKKWNYLCVYRINLCGWGGGGGGGGEVSD